MVGQEGNRFDGEESNRLSLIEKARTKTLCHCVTKTTPSLPATRGKIAGLYACRSFLLYEVCRWEVRRANSRKHAVVMRELLG